MNAFEITLRIFATVGLCVVVVMICSVVYTAWVEAVEAYGKKMCLTNFADVTGLSKSKLLTTQEKIKGELARRG